MKTQVPHKILKWHKKHRLAALYRIHSWLIIIFFSIFLFCSLQILRTMNKIELSETSHRRVVDFSKSRRHHFPKPNLKESSEERQSCQFPNLDISNASFMEILRKDKILLPEKELLCKNKENPHLFDSFVDLPLGPRIVPRKKRIKKLKIKSCCYGEIPTDAKKLKTVANKCYPISLESTTEISDEQEFIAIQCTFLKSKLGKVLQVPNAKIVDVHAFVEKKPKVVKRASKRRRKLKRIKKNGVVDNFNVVVLGLDGVSRMTFQRTMPKTRDYLVNILNAVEMEGFTKIGDNVLSNIGPLLTNVPMIDGVRLQCVQRNSSENCPFIWKKYADYGYHTLYAEDELDRTIFRSLKLGLSNTPFFSSPPLIDYFFPYFAAAADLLISHDKRSSTKFCYGPRSAFQVMLDYMQKLGEVMGRSENYFQFAWSSSLTRDFVTGGMLIDKSLRSALKWWNEGDHLKNTVFILMSGHGSRIGGANDPYQGQMEANLPFMYFVVPPRFQGKYQTAYRNLVDNRKRLISPWDVYQTLDHLLQPDMLEDHAVNVIEKPMVSSISDRSPGISLFSRIPLSRTCESAGIPLNYCSCNRHMQPLPVDSSLAKQAARHAINSVNGAIAVSPTSHLCAYMFLGKIISAGRVTFGNSFPSSSLEHIQVLFQAQPGFETFEALLINQNWTNTSAPPEWSVAGTISRTSPYKNQSWCLDEAEFKAQSLVEVDKIKRAKIYCYCLPKRDPKK